MNSKTGLRVASVCMGAILLGHSVATFFPSSYGTGADIVLSSMKAYRFQTFGVERSYFDFYSGGNLSLILFMALQTLLLWQLSSWSKLFPRDLANLLWVFIAVDAVFSFICWKYYFAAPALFATVGTASLFWAQLSLEKQIRKQGR